jgi:mono/diheme cytochrome c family protein
MKPPAACLPRQRRPRQTRPGAQLAGSEWVAKDVTSLARIPLAGSERPDSGRRQGLESFHGADGRGLSDADLAAVLTYIRGSWGNKYGAVSADEVKAARAAISGNAPSAADLAKMTPVERGHAVYQKYGCFQCHGQDAKGGVPNPNAKTAEQVPSLIYVADGYTKDELKSFIKRGERDIPVDAPGRAGAAAFHAFLGQCHQHQRTGRSGRLSLQLETQGRQTRAFSGWTSGFDRLHHPTVPGRVRITIPNFHVHPRPFVVKFPAMLRKIQPNKVRAPGGSFAIVASRYNARYVDAMLRAAKAELWRAEVASIEVVRVPGAYEIPVAAKRLARTTHPPPPTLRLRGAPGRRFAATAAAFGDYLSGRDFARRNGPCGAHRRSGQPRADANPAGARNSRRSRSAAAGKRGAGARALSESQAQSRRGSGANGDGDGARDGKIARLKTRPWCRLKRLLRYPLWRI